MSRTALAILSTENLLHNVQVIRKQAPHAHIVAMVKANGYGHGLRSTSLRLEKSVDILGVSSIDEALALRKVGVKIPILLSEGVFEPKELSIASEENFAVAFHSSIQMQWLNTVLLSRPIHAWLKVNTGLGRLGFSAHEISTIYKQLYDHPSTAKPITIMSHFACADTPEHPLNAQQADTFNTLTKTILGTYSICNSASLFTYPSLHHHYIRPGIAIYGISPFTHIPALDLGLKPVMTVRSTLIAVNNMAKGASISYNAQFICPENMPVGVVAFGYGDGYPITAQNGTPILINDTQCSLIGRVAMDMLMVDLRNAPHARIGDPVTLWGDGLPLEEIAKHTHTIAWEILTSIQNRVQCIWTT
jgi:alanine racemase